MSRVSVRMVAMVLTVLAGALACRAGSGASAAVPAPAVDEVKATAKGKRDGRGGGGMLLGNPGGVSACEGRDAARPRDTRGVR